MSASDGSERQWTAASEEERAAIARQVAEAMDIRRMMGAHTRIAGCQGCGQCLAKPATESASSAQPATSAELTEGELVRLVQDTVREVIQELQARSAR